MKFNTNIQENNSTNLIYIERMLENVGGGEVFSFYAYATWSGCAAFKNILEIYGDSFKWNWLIGIDYGRTQPKAIEFLLNKNHDVRIYDAKFVLDSKDFVPRRTYHPKAIYALNDNNCGAYIGSGNFSGNGLNSGLEVSTSMLSLGLSKNRSRSKIVGSKFNKLKKIFCESIGAGDIIETYIDRYKEQYNNLASFGASSISPCKANLFWIDIGYVTKNRGEGKAGNQIDMPRGVSEFFGFDGSSAKKNSVIGKLNISYGEEIYERNLRLGNNLMEKITLPIPDELDFKFYDGKFLHFLDMGDGSFKMRVIEQEDHWYFLSLCSSSDVHHMASQRSYGFATR